MATTLAKSLSVLSMLASHTTCYDSLWESVEWCGTHVSRVPAQVRCSAWFMGRTTVQVSVDHVDHWWLGVWLMSAFFSLQEALHQNCCACAVQLGYIQETLTMIHFSLLTNRCSCNHAAELTSSHKAPKCPARSERSRPATVRDKICCWYPCHRTKKVRRKEVFLLAISRSMVAGVIFDVFCFVCHARGNRLTDFSAHHKSTFSCMN